MRYLNQDSLSLDSHSKPHHNVLFLYYYCLVTVKGCFLDGILREWNFGINSFNKKVNEYIMRWLEYVQYTQEDLLPKKILPYIYQRVEEYRKT
jgi:hypothetical protein